MVTIWPHSKTFWHRHANVKCSYLLQEESPLTQTSCALSSQIYPPLQVDLKRVLPVNESLLTLPNFSKQFFKTKAFSKTKQHQQTPFFIERSFHRLCFSDSKRWAPKPLGAIKLVGTKPQQSHPCSSLRNLRRMHCGKMGEASETASIKID